MRSKIFRRVSSQCYKVKGVYNRILNRFEEVDPTQTLWVADNEFRLSGAMKIVGLFMAGAFKKESKRTLDHFKHCVEEGVSVTELTHTP